MFTIPPPKDWQTFEALCKDLWSEILDDRNIQLHGRGGQTQHGVDIFGKNKEGRNYGIQCKQKSHSQNLTIEEVDAEIKKAESFSPKLDVYILATTAPKDQKIETHVREISERNSTNGKFLVYVYGWGDVEFELNNYSRIFLKYYGGLIDVKSPNDIYFDFWYKEASIEKLSYYACHLPFGAYNIRYSYIYANILVGYLNKHDVFLANTNAASSDEALKRYVQLFNNFVRISINLINEYSPKEDALQSNSDIVCIYWVDCSHLDYCEQGEFIESKKIQLRQSFYNLIQAANKIISIWNIKLNAAQQIPLTEFSQPNANFPLLGKIFLIEPHYPMLEN